jgi:hypothetical protein
MRLYEGRVRTPTIIVWLLLAGCAAVEPAAREVAYIAPEIPFATPPARALGYSVEAVQLVTARWREESFVFEGRLSAAPEGMRLVGVDPFGRRAFTVTSSDRGVEAETARWVPEGLRAENVLADLAIVYWPDEAVRGALAGSGAELRTEPARRSIVAGGRELVRVDYAAEQRDAWKGRAHYRNLAFGYELELRSTAVIR